MLAIDTNIVVRILTGDDVQQARRARAVVEANAVFVATTVLLEAAWVLRSARGYASEQALSALKAFVGLPGVVLQEPERVALAMRWAESGMSFPDAIHLAAAGDCEVFVTFDDRMAKSAAKAGAIPVRRPRVGRPALTVRR